MQFLHEVLYIIVWIVPLFTSENTEFCPTCNSPDDCLSSLTQKDCPDGTYLVASESLCKCCPKCKTGLEFGDMCNPIRKCAPGLSCINQVCVFDKSGCSYTYHLPNFKNLPTCEVDGSYAAVQCKGDRTTGRCFCYAETGERIYGFSWYRDSQNMTCECSRLKHKLNKGDRYDNTLHCDTKGNFEPLQCDDGICWCANAKTGEIIKGTRVVPEAMWDRLPCYVVPKGPKEVMKVSYTRGVVVSEGNGLTPTQVKDQPKVEWNADGSALYTLCMTDLDAPSRAESKFREWHHWLVGNIPGNDVSKGLSAYVGSGPSKDTGLHRYVFFVYKQDRQIKFDEKKLPNNSGEARGCFSIKKFTDKYKLGDPVAGNLYQAQWNDYVPK